MTDHDDTDGVLVPGEHQRTINDAARRRSLADALEIERLSALLASERERTAALWPLARAVVQYGYRSGCRCRVCAATTAAIDALPPALRTELEADDAHE